jgi:puromycin-sensitive aminopeptidase
MADLDPYRLPTDVTPIRYELELAPDLDAATFAGSVAIAVTVHSPVSEVVLNALELDLDEAWVIDASGERLDATVRLDADSERAFLGLTGELRAGTATVHVRFRGILNDKLHGFYRSTFTDGEGATRTIATTQMEATYARKAFPCWDEPAHKAVFSVALVVPEGTTALSNGAEIDRQPAADGLVRVQFADTIPMSTYLVAFVIGPLEVTDPVDVDGVPLRIAHPVGKGHLTPFALEVAAACLRWFTNYYGIPYPGGKLDHVAIPDFAFGAMENQGCITYREVLLLAEPAKATQPELLNLVDVVNHETAHMWFGNLVTMKWWNGIWLNEAFATFMEMKATEAFRPDWQRWIEFGLSRTAAMETDALDSTRPIEFHVESPDDAEGMFDVLTYEKGGAVLRMLEQFLGEDQFRDGVRRYLGTHAYGNTENSDLWDAIEEVTGQPVRRIMDSWIFQGGHPIISVERAGNTGLKLHQERFRLSEAIDPDGGQREGLGDVWAIPVVLRVGAADGGTRELRVLLDERETTVDIGGPAGWVVANGGGEGAYRVRYSPELRSALVDHGIGRLQVLERYGILNDAHGATLAGTMHTSELLELTRAFADEPDGAVWKLLAAVFDDLDRLLEGDDREALAAHVRAVAGPALRRLGFAPAEGDDDRTREMRATLLRTAAILGEDTEAIREALRLRAAEVAEPGSIDPALAGAATAIAAHYGDAEAFQLGYKRYTEAATPQEEVRELYNLARTRDEASFDLLLARCLDEIRTQNAPYLLRAMLANRELGHRAWPFVRQHWDEINERFPSNSIVRMLEGVRSITDPAIATDIQGFFAEHEVPQGALQLAQHLERQKIGVALRQRDGDALAEALHATLG